MWQRRWAVSQWTGVGTLLWQSAPLSRCEWLRNCVLPIEVQAQETSSRQARDDLLRPPWHLPASSCHLRTVTVFCSFDDKMTVNKWSAVSISFYNLIDVLINIVDHCKWCAFTSILVIVVGGSVLWTFVSPRNPNKWERRNWFQFVWCLQLEVIVGVPVLLGLSPPCSCGHIGREL